MLTASSATDGTKLYDWYPPTDWYTWTWGYVCANSSCSEVYGKYWALYNSQSHMISDTTAASVDSEPFPTWLGLAGLQHVDCLCDLPGLPGQQRSLRRIFHDLSWAFALSPGAWSFACARLASFWDLGLFFPL